MLLSAAMITLATIGLVVPCLIDAVRTPWYAFGRPAKETWLVMIAVLWVPGALAWLLVGRRRRNWPEPRAWHGHPDGRRRISQREALRRHPAWRSAEPGYGAGDDPAGAAGLNAGLPARPVGPDDDAEFLLELRRRIRGTDDGR